MPDNDICPQCERAVQGNKVFCRICTGEHGGGNDNDGPPNGERPESTVESPSPSLAPMAEPQHTVDGTITPV